MKANIAINSILAIAIGTSLLTGCATDRSVLGHRPALTGQTRLDLTPARDINDWREKYYTSTSETNRAFYRNEIIRRLMRLDDESFNAWSQKLYGARAISSGVADFATGLMGAFAAASGASAAKSLGLAVAGVSGARSAAEKDIFFEKSAGALISKMKEDRAKVDAQITQYLDKNTVQYPLEQGLRDIIRYYEAGTLASASETLQADAKVAQLGAQAQVEDIKGDRVVAPSEIAKAQIQPELTTRTKETKITDEQLIALRKQAQAEARARGDVDALIAPTLKVVKDANAQIFKKDPTKKIDYGKLMDESGDDKANIAQFTRDRAGFADWLKSNATNDKILNAVQTSAKNQIPKP